MRLIKCRIVFLVLLSGQAGCHKVDKHNDKDTDSATETASVADGTASQLDSDTDSWRETDTPIPTDEDTGDADTLGPSTDSPADDSGSESETSQDDTEMPDTQTETETFVDSNACYVGDFSILSTQAARAFDEVACIRGNLTIGPSDVDIEVSLPNMLRISGAVVVNGNASQSVVSMENLTELDSLVVGFNGSVSVDLSRVPAIPEGVTISSNGDPKVTEAPISIELELGTMTESSTINITGNQFESMSVDLHSLTTLSSSLIVDGNFGVSEINISSLQTVGDMILISSTSGLGKLDLGRLKEIRTSLYVSVNDDMVSIDLSALTTVGETLSIAANPELEAIDLGSLVAVQEGNFVVAANPLLTSIDISALESVGESFVYGQNTSLSCDPTAITAQVAAKAWTFCENHPDGSCGDEICL